MNCCDISLTKPLLDPQQSSGNNNKKNYFSYFERTRRRLGIYKTSRRGYSEFELENKDESWSRNCGGKGESDYHDEMGLNKESCGLMFRRIGLLLWKNFLFRRRHYVVTAFEVILPTVLAMLMAYLRTQAPKGSNTDYPNGEQFPFDMTSWASNIFSCYDCFVAYAPSNREVDQIMTQVYEYLPDQGRNKFGLKGFGTEEEIELYVSQSSFNDTQGKIKAAVIFTNGIAESASYSSKIAYKIRMVDNWDLPSTYDMFQRFQFPGPQEDNVIKYMKAGFSGFQVAIDKVIIRRITNETGPAINTQAFPYPPFVRIIDFTIIYFILLPQLLVIGFIFIVPAIIRNVVSEKETGIKELMKMMGLPNWMHWLGWMLNSLIMLTISITIVVILFFVKFDENAGAVLNNSDPSLWWVVLVLYAMSATSFCFFVSTFFQKPTLAIVAGIVVWFVSYYGITQPMEHNYQSLSFPTKLSSALVPNAALHWAIKALCAFEGRGVGAHWRNLFDPISSVDELSVGWICLMFVVDTVLYMSLTIYFENIIPSEFGVRKPWYYIFKPSTWVGSGKVASRISSAQSQRSYHSADEDGGPKPGFEPDQEGLVPGVVIDGLTKKFSGGKLAVDRVSLKMNDGEITALLGHNGAGKTTTMSMLTGLFAPTSGTAKIKGYDIKTSMDKVRQNLGLCPQHNMLFDKLTVEEHLIFFGRLKGLTSSQAKTEMKSFLEKLQLREKRSTLAGALSGGQKRKLSLGMALIGGTKVVILDEPTSGMDPEARRAIWDLLLEMRGQRTIILTTHFMEEADVLGDKIAIMASGKVKCHGTPMFLKKFYGAGYTLKVTTTDPTCANMILASVQKYIPYASYKPQQNQHHHSGYGTEIRIVLPSERNTTKAFPDMFSELGDLKDELGIQTIGLSLTTMDEVFVKVGELDNVELSNGTDAHDGSVISRNGSDGRSALLRSRLTGLALAGQQFMGLLIKRIIYTVRKRRLFISQFLMPILLLIAAIRLSNRSLEPTSFSPPLKMSLDTYTQPKTPYTYDDENLGKTYKKLVGSSAVPLQGPIVHALMEIGAADLASYRERYIVGAEFNSSTNVSALFSSIPFHSSPLAINLVSTTLLNSISSRQSAGNGKEYSIDMTIHPLESDSYSVLEAARPDPVFSMVVPILFGIFVPIGLALFAASFIVFPIEERLCKAKQLQLMTGINPIIFWGSSFLWDFFVMTILICFMLLCFPIFQKFGAFTPYGGGGVFFLILLTFGFSSISFSYMFSLVAGTVPGGFSLVTIIHIVTGVILSLTVFMMESAGLAEHVGTVRLVGRLFPAFGVSVAIMRYTSIATTNSRCNILSQAAKDIVCNPHIRIDDSLRQCCDNCKDFGIGNCFEPQSYLKWTDQTLKFPQDVSGIGQDLFYLFVIGLVYKLLLVLIEYGVIKRLLGFIFKVDKASFQLKTDDANVLKENDRVDEIVKQGRTEEDAFLVQNLCKSYGSFAAVSNLSFGVHHGECFGLLGVNGAGKTTCFRMLTGDEIRSDGNAFIIKYTLERNRKTYLGNIGYCPQFDGIVEVLTGREMLQLFSRIRGIPRDFVDAEADKWLHKLGLYESRDVQCGKYSGGMKRRLSAAMAMIGDCPVILLDEPTSGVDPIARRQFWEVINSVKESGQAVILTSHSMEECEALCSRLGIMVNGQFQCLGGVQHLKNKFAQGFSLVMKLKTLIPPNSQDLIALCNDITARFEPCTLKDQHQNILQYQLLNTSMPWHILFKNMEALKDQYPNLIEDYSVNETTLEEVFLSFARLQYPERQANVSFMRKLLTCQCCS